MAKDEILNYCRIQRSIWYKKRFRSLSQDAQLLFLYLAINPHGNMVGLYVLRPGYALEDLNWGDSERYDKALRELLDKQLIEYDETNHVIFDKQLLDKFPLHNENQVKAAIKKLEELPNTPLFQSLKLLLERFNKPYYERFHKWLGKQVTVEVEVTVDETVDEKSEAEIFNLPSVDEITHSSYPKIKEDLNTTCHNLYKDKIFSQVYAFTNKNLKDGMNPRAILHTLGRCFMAKPKEPWGYCTNILKVENGNYNERDNQKTS